MSKAIITVEDLGKKYQILHRGAGRGSASFREALSLKAASLVRSLTQINRRRPGGESDSASTREEFWALREVSFEVKEGEVLGIIGRNGAGKSTLLKVLSRITEPTEGRVHIRGRAASLLEVGTGFHPELTGRENIFLNGAILGMSRVEIKRKFDEIVEFSGVERFLDTPVKRYSSGMYVRLAFAVAAHLEPEILIVDEVLAVGDTQFQQKCLGKMKDVSRGGRTVLFVSHNMSAVGTLCSQALLLKEGSVSWIGSVSECIERYSIGSQLRGPVWERTRPFGKDSPPVFTKISAELEGKQPVMTLHVDFEIFSQINHKPAFVAVDILDDTDTAIMQAIPTLDCFITSGRQDSLFRISVDLPPLVPGHYSASFWVGPHNFETFDEVRSAISFEILDSPTGDRTMPHSREHGRIVPMSSVRIQSRVS